MFEQITTLEEISAELKKVHSLLNLLCDYFSKANPQAWELMHRYDTYSDLVDVVHSIIIQQRECIDKSSGKLFSLQKELRKLAEKNIELLSGNINA